MKNTTTKNYVPRNANAFEQICAGLVHLRKKEVNDQQLMLKMHEGMARVIAGQLRINRAFQAAAQAA